MTVTYRSDAPESIHESMMALYAVGAIDQPTMQEFDETCLKCQTLFRAALQVFPFAVGPGVCRQG
jgi:DNA-binding transcriptional regulator YiaG